MNVPYNTLDGKKGPVLHFISQSATLDLKGSTGDTSLQFVCTYPKIELLEIGMFVFAAGGVVTIQGQIRLDYLPKNNGSRVNGFGAPWTTTGFNSLATGLTTLSYSFGASAVVYTPLVQSLNPYETGIVPTSVNPTGQNPTPGPATYPTMVFGDTCIWNLITAGTGGGAQTVRPYVAYRAITLT